MNLDSPNHREHVAYPESGTFESVGPCPASHPVRLPQILLETVWDTKQFNNKADWPADGSQVRASPPLSLHHFSIPLIARGANLFVISSPSHGHQATTPASPRTPITSLAGRTIHSKRPWTARRM